MTDFIFVYITCKNKREAGAIGQALVAENLAACVNIIPGMTSIYRWEGRLKKARETILIAKTRKSQFKILEARVKKAHSYETPCIVSFDISEGNADFLKWIEAETID